MLPRFYVPGNHAAEHVIELPDDEAAHLTRVLRLSAGDAIRIFDGLGREWQATVGEASRHGATARIEHEVVPLAEPAVAITLGVAVLKGDKMDAVVRDAVMLGATAIQPVLTERTEVAATMLERGGRVARWQRIAASSAKQCGRAVVPAVRNAIRLTEALAGTTRTDGESFSLARPVVLLVEPQAGDGARSLRDLPRSQALFLLVGPEGGWTAGEVQQARAAGAMLVTLGTQVLRADAAPIVAITAVRVAFGDF